MVLVPHSETEVSVSDDKTARIRELNDQLRRSLYTGKVVYTAGVAALDVRLRRNLVAAVQAFNDFDQDNDPYGEHDFGRIEIEGQVFFWKIDYYDQAMQAGSEDPSDPKETMRVLTIMLADEY